MVKAWYMDNSNADQRLEHHLDPPKYVDLDTLKLKTGVLYWKLDSDNYEKEGKLEKLCQQRGYNYKDFLTCSKEKLANYEEKLKNFFQEHIHADEEIRFILNGGGYFDVRDDEDKWIRIEVSKGDLIILPAGIYHRFTLDMKNYIEVMRLFIGEPVWTPINRPADDHPARIDYVKSLLRSEDFIIMNNNYE